MAYIYRYRPLEIKKDGSSNLLDELRNNYFYLTKSSNENDTNEGRPDFFLKGNKNLWLGIFRYFYYYVGAYELMKRDTLNNITNSMINKSTKFVNAKEFLNDNKINLVLDSIENKPISLLKLKIIFLSVLNTAIKYINKSIGIPKEYIIPTLQYMDKTCLTKLAIKLIINPKHKENAQIILDEAYFHAPKNIRQILMDYICLIKNFINSLTHLSLPAADIVSFAKNDNDDAMWGQYANAYDGVCLKYKVSYNSKLHKYKLRINNNKAHLLYKVYYQNKLNQYNLFKYLNPNLKFLFKICSKYVPHKKQLQNNYRNMQIRSFSTKDLSWKHENEYREILFNVSKSKQYYDFHTLKAVILGSQISEEYKDKIVQILQDQCNAHLNVKQFYIYEMQRTDNYKDKTPRKPIPLLKYNNMLRKFVPWIKGNDISIYPNIL